jgi:hypothetical protein
MDEVAATGAAPGTARGPVFSESGLAGPVAWDVPGDVRPLPASDAPESLGRPLVPLKAASPRLSHDLFTRLLSYGTPQPTEAGDVLFEAGDGDVDMIVVGQGSVEVIRAATAGSMKRVAAATGEGASAIASVHKVIAFASVSASS